MRKIYLYGMMAIGLSAYMASGFADIIQLEGDPPPSEYITEESERIASESSVGGTTPVALGGRSTSVKTQVHKTGCQYSTTGKTYTKSSRDGDSSCHSGTDGTYSNMDRDILLNMATVAFSAIYVSEKHLDHAGSTGDGYTNVGYGQGSGNSNAWTSPQGTFSDIPISPE